MILHTNSLIINSDMAIGEYRNIFEIDTNNLGHPK